MKLNEEFKKIDDAYNYVMTHNCAFSVVLIDGRYFIGARPDKYITYEGEWEELSKSVGAPLYEFLKQNCESGESWVSPLRSRLSFSDFKQRVFDSAVREVKRQEYRRQEAERQEAKWKEAERQKEDAVKK